MKKQIIQIFHNMIDKEKKSDRKNAHETWEESEQGSEGSKQVGVGETVNVVQPDLIVMKDAFGKVMDQKNFEKSVNNMLREDRKPGCMLIADLDRFKYINEIYGRVKGDAALRNAVNILNAYFEQCVCIGRAGGDIFILWIPGLSGEDADYIRRQVGQINDRLLHPEKELPPLSVSVGVAFYEDGDDCRKLGKRASKMLYRVKESGRCGCEIEIAS